MDETVTEVLVACISAIAVIVAAIITARGHKKPEGNTFNNKGSVSAPIVQGNGTVEDIVMGNVENNAAPIMLGNSAGGNHAAAVVRKKQEQIKQKNADLIKCYNEQDF